MSHDNANPATESNANDSDAEDATEAIRRPPVSAADRRPANMPTVPIPEELYYPLGEHAGQIADTWSGDRRDHLTGLLGEAAVAEYLGITDQLDVEVYTDGGDGGVDLEFRGATMDVKTVGQPRSGPDLTVDAYKPLRADFYALASRVGETEVRLVGYAPCRSVAQAPRFSHKGRPYYTLGQEYLHPFW